MALYKTFIKTPAPYFGLCRMNEKQAMATDYITKTEREFATNQQGSAGNEADF